MQNILVNMCEKFHYDRLRNDRALGNGKSGNNKNNVRSHWGPTRFRVQNSKATLTLSLSYSLRSLLFCIVSEQPLSVVVDHTADVIKDVKDNDVDSLRRVFHALKIEPCRLRLASISPVISGKNALTLYFPSVPARLGLHTL